MINVAKQPDLLLLDVKHAGERRFDLVIGADGLHSTVRKLIFGSQSQFERHLGHIVAAFEVRGYRPRDEDVCLIYGQPGRDGRALYAVWRSHAHPARVCCG